MKIMQSTSHRVSRKSGASFRVSMALAALAIVGLLAGCGSSSHGTHLAYVAAGVWQLGADWRFGALLLGIGVYGLATLALYRRRILEA